MYLYISVVHPVLSGKVWMLFFETQIYEVQDNAQWPLCMCYESGHSTLSKESLFHYECTDTQLSKAVLLTLSASN